MSENLPQTLLIVDDDVAFTNVLARVMGTRGYACSVANTGTAALQLAAQIRPRHCLLDLKLGETSGLRLIPDLLRSAPGMRILLLTGYASIATAVEAIKRGAHDYLAKPVDADQIARALSTGAPRMAAVSAPPPDAPPHPAAQAGQASGARAARRQRLILARRRRRGRSRQSHARPGRRALAHGYVATQAACLGMPRPVWVRRLCAST